MTLTSQGSIGIIKDRLVLRFIASTIMIHRNNLQRFFVFLAVVAAASNSSSVECDIPVRPRTTTTIALSTNKKLLLLHNIGRGGGSNNKKNAGASLCPPSLDLDDDDWWLQKENWYTDPLALFHEKENKNKMPKSITDGNILVSILNESYLIPEIIGQSLNIIPIVLTATTLFMMFIIKPLQQLSHRQKSNDEEEEKQSSSKSKKLFVSNNNNNNANADNTSIQKKKKKKKREKKTIDNDDNKITMQQWKERCLRAERDVYLMKEEMIIMKQQYMELNKHYNDIKQYNIYLQSIQSNYDITLQNTISTVQKDTNLQKEQYKIALLNVTKKELNNIRNEIEYQTIQLKKRVSNMASLSSSK